MSTSCEVEVLNEAGLHARPCHAVVATALQYGSDLRISCGARVVNGRSILELMTLEAAQGAVLLLEADGEDGEALLEALGALFQSGFAESG